MRHSFLPKFLDKGYLLSVYLSFSKLCWGQGMATYTKPQQWKKEESERLRGEGDQIMFIDLDFKDCKLQDSGIQE